MGVWVCGCVGVRFHTHTPTHPHTRSPEEPDVIYSRLPGRASGIGAQPAGADARRGRHPESLRDFTSDLSVNEFLLVREAGFDPLGLVLGSSIYHIGFQAGQWNKSQEMDVLTQAMYHARELAMTRMEEEADQLGGDGVVGVRLDVSRYEWGNDLAEFLAIGSAVRHRGGRLHAGP